jgi:hypothetical protein
MEKKTVADVFADVAAAPSKELEIFNSFINNMQRAGIPADRGVLVGRLDEVREMIVEIKKAEILHEFHGAVGVGKAANSEAAIRRWGGFSPQACAT